MDRRYLKRMTAYWARKLKESLLEIDRLDFTTWFDLWHTHPDWNSKGNRCVESRAMVANSTYQILKRAEKLALDSALKIQVFATVCADSRSNAVFLHTENPNGTTFPQQFPNILWGAPQPPELQGVVDHETHEVGRMQYGEEIDYIIRRRIAEE